MSADKNNPDNSSTYKMDEHDRKLYTHAETQLAQFKAPVLVSTNNPHEKLYIAAFDGTGNDRTNPEMGQKTNVALIYEQVENLRTKGHRQLAAGYVPGPGTQSGTIASTRDNISGHTYDARLEEMYYKFIKQAKQWLDGDPKAQIRLADIGFSRGAEQAAGFARLVHERGIQDPQDVKITRGSDGLIQKLEFTKPPLVAAGKVPQVEGLFDPVGTGVPHARDRRPPPSVISGFMIKAEDEARDQFPSTHILDKGFTHGDRFLRVLTAGAHSDIGGGYHLDGLARRNGNLMIDYLNALSDKPFLTKLALAPEKEVIHRSEEHRFVYTTDVMQKRIANGFDETQKRGFIESIGGNLADTSAAARDAQPRDAQLNSQFERQAVRIGPVPERKDAREQEAQREDAAKPPAKAPKEKSFLDGLIDRLATGALEKDDALMRSAVMEYQQSPQGQRFEREVAQLAQTQAAQERQAALDAQQLSLQNTPARGGQAMTM